MGIKSFDNYLSNPVEAGVHKLILDLKEEPVLELIKTHKSEFREYKEQEERKENAMFLLISHLDCLSYPEKEFNEKITKTTINKIKNFIECLNLDFNDIRKECQKLDLRSKPLNELHCKVKAGEDLLETWENVYFKKYKDSIYCEVMDNKKEGIKIVFISLKKEILEVLREIFKVLFKDSLKDSKFIESHKYEEAILIYPSILALSLKEKHLSEFGYVIADLKSALEYFFDITEEKQRVSAIFSGIALEEQLGIIYENEAKKRAPDVPLGWLLRELDKEIPKFEIPKFINIEIKQAIDIRNSSVHRSIKDIEFSDAIKAMIAPMMLLIWYSRKKGILK